MKYLLIFSNPPNTYLMNPSTISLNPSEAPPVNDSHYKPFQMLARPLQHLVDLLDKHEDNSPLGREGPFAKCIPVLSRPLGVMDFLNSVNLQKVLSIPRDQGLKNL